MLVQESQASSFLEDTRRKSPPCMPLDTSYCTRFTAILNPRPPRPAAPASHVCPEQLFLHQRALYWEPQMRACS